MATPGFAGKILLINLTTKQISALDSAKYEDYGGGHGTGTALFWDLCVAPGGWDLQDAFDPKNIVALIPFSLKNDPRSLHHSVTFSSLITLIKRATS